MLETGKENIFRYALSKSAAWESNRAHRRTFLGLSAVAGTGKLCILVTWD